MNITGRPVYQKGTSRKSRAVARKSNAEEKAHWDKIAQLPCIIGPDGCNYHGRAVTRHHCGTGAGGRKDHMKVVPLCWEHHLGKEGIDGKRMSKKKWQEKYATEEIMLRRTAHRIKHL